MAMIQSHDTYLSVRQYILVCMLNLGVFFVLVKTGFFFLPDDTLMPLDLSLGLQQVYHPVITAAKNPKMLAECFGKR